MKTQKSQKCWAYSDLSHGHSCTKSYIKPVTHAPETGATGLNMTPDFGTSFSCRCRGPKAVNDVRSCASAQKTGAGIWRQIYRAGFWSVCQGPKVKYAHLKSSRKLLSPIRKTNVDNNHWCNAKQWNTAACEDELLSCRNQTYVCCYLLVIIKTAKTQCTHNAMWCSAAIQQRHKPINRCVAKYVAKDAYSYMSLHLSSRVM